MVLEDVPMLVVEAITAVVEGEGRQITAAGHQMTTGGTIDSRAILTGKDRNLSATTGTCVYILYGTN